MFPAHAVDNPTQKLIGLFPPIEGISFFGYLEPYVTTDLIISRNLNNDEFNYHLRLKVVVFIPTTPDVPLPPPPISLWYWMVPNSNNYAFFFQYKKVSQQPQLPYTLFNAVYIEQDIVVEQDGPFTVTTYLHDEDPETSRGTVTTVQSATPIQ